MNRAEFQKLAIERITDAKALLAAKRWSAAYYLSGYAVECGLKACILVRVTAEAEAIFEEKRFSEKCWTHDLEQLLGLAKLNATLNAACAGDSELAKNWEVVAPWSELSRYSLTTKTKAENLYEATANKKHGVLSWINQCW